MLSGDLVAGELLDISLSPVVIVVSLVQCISTRRDNSHITHGNHANRLPDAETNTGGNAAVETGETVGRVDVAESVTDSHLLGSVGVLLLALHLNTDNLDGLVPGGETTTKTGGKNLLPGAELLTFLLAGDVADALLSETGQTETGTPVGHLADSDSVDTLVDTADTLLAVDVHESGEGALGCDARGSHLVLGNLDRLHASAEAHGGISLGHTAGDTTDDTTTELRGTVAAGVEFGFGGDEEEDGALGGGFDPGPRDKTLVDYEGSGQHWMLKWVDSNVVLSSSIRS